MSCNKLMNSLFYICLALVFTNCAPMVSAQKHGAVGFSTAAQEIGSDGVLFSTLPLNQLSKESDLHFFADELLFDEPIKSVIWDHNLNGNDFCEQSPGENSWSVKINCSQAGSLNLFFIVEYESGVDESFIATVPVLEEAVINPDIDPGVIPDTPVPLDGSKLYSVSCAGCHGTGANSAKKGRSAGQIQNAIRSNTGGMSILSTLSTAEITAISEYLGTL